MKRTYDGMMIAAALTASAGASALTDEEKAALASEIANDTKSMGYAGKTPAEILWLLGNEYQEANPEPQPMLDLEYVEAGVVRNLLQISTMDNGKNSWRYLYEAAQADESMWVAYQAIEGNANAGKPLRLTNPQVSTMLPTFVSLGLVTRESVDSITKEPDTNWPEFLGPKRRLWEILGEGTVIDLSDIEEALNA